jgi:hypothetical protein
MHAYMDESSDKESRLFCIGGFVGRADAWMDLMHRWIERLRPHQLPNPIKAFHMTDCENAGGEFRDELGWDRDSRKQLIIDLLEIICGYPVAMFGVALPLKEYFSLDPINDQGDKLGKSQYHFLFQSALADLASELETTDFLPYDNIAFFFDRNSPYEYWANRLHKEIKEDKRLKWRHRIGSLKFESKEKLRLLQVGDIGAYESMKHMANALYNEGRTRRSFQKLATTNHVWKLATHTPDSLTETWRLKTTELRELTEKKKAATV